ncbi:MAG: bifunctional phosphopantothenoylcysteine decarboxylase/phosphopantothenate--cysteine ligase CoaBC [Eubacteriales bacterium]|nr:bifunctional phosphopantothenoylcysteine decarboxylase/phosphopantothenate--cysteine ligase CoaBC [Eubacteriales bacterium]
MKTVVVGITGGIAAYRAADVVSQLKKDGYCVRVVMTKNATRFVAPLTFETLSANPVVTDMFNRETPWEVEHISLAKAADLILVLPATANVIGKVAAGIADDMLTTTIMAARCPVLFAPAMNEAMYTNPIVQRNIEDLSALGYRFVGPKQGALACGDVGIGHVEEKETILRAAYGLLEPKRDFAGKKIVITAGPTREPIDPVRYISNRSSGKMGYALAAAAAARGADVTLVSGPVSLKAPAGVKVVPVRTTAEMLETVMKEYVDADIVIKAAAPADYCIRDVSPYKIKKTKEEISLNLSLNPDIAAAVGKEKGDRFLVIFAAETNDVLKNGMDKLERKNADLIVINDVSQEGAGFEVDTNIVTIVDREGNHEVLPMMRKDEVAGKILDSVARHLKL